MSKRSAKVPEPEGDRPVPRPMWSGSLTFGLVSVAVALFSALRSARTSLRMVSADGTPLRRRYICPQEQRPIAPEEIVRGYEVEKGRFVVLTDAELEALEPEKSREIDLRRFVPLDQIDPIYFDRPYLMVPGGDSSKAYRLLAETLQSTARAGIATFVMRDKEYLVAIWARDGLMRAETLRFADEVRTPDDVGLPEASSGPDALVEAMRTEIGGASGDRIGPDDLRDEDDAQLRRLIADKRGSSLETGSTEASSADQGAEVIDLMALIKRSVQGQDPDSPAPAGPSPDRLENQTKAALYERAKALDLPGRSSMSKQQLIDALRRLEAQS